MEIVDFSLLTLPFFQRAALTGLILSILMAPLGVLVVLRRLSFFSDAIGHAALTGIAIGLLLQINPFLSALVFSLLVAVAMANARRHTKLPFDTLLGVFFSASVALGVILIQLTPGFQTSLISFLFGDILTVSTTDVILALIMAAVTFAAIIFAGKAFVAIALDPELAQAEGIPVHTYELIFLLVLAGIIALAIKMIGVMLVTAMLIIPAASALNLSRSLSTLFIISGIVSIAATLAGLITSASLNTATGPTIVLIAAAVFVASLLFRPRHTSQQPTNNQ